MLSDQRRFSIRPPSINMASGASHRIETGGDRNSESQFDSVPKELKYKIFASLNCKDIVSARMVCKSWQGMLSQSAIQGMAQSLQPLTDIPSGFLVKISIKNSATDKDEGGGFCVSIDKNGVCKREKIVDNMSLAQELDLTCNGMVCSLSPLVRPEGRIEVCNPSLKWRVTVPPYPGDHFQTTLHNKWTNTFQFQGASYEPFTGFFTLLIGHAVFQVSRNVKYTIHVYRSETGEWESLALAMPETDCVIPLREGVYSGGYFLWMDGYYPKNPSKGVLAFSLSEKLFYSISLPDCPLHPDYRGWCVFNGGAIRRGGCYENYERHVGVDVEPWVLKGSHGNVTIFHYVDLDLELEDLEDSSAPLPTDDPTVAWALLQNAGHVSTWTWEPLEFRLDGWKLGVHRANCFYNTNKMRQWLWSPKCFVLKAREQNDLVLLDPKGELLHDISLWDLVPDEDDIPSGCYAIVDGVWVFETNNLWQILQSS